MPENEFDLAVAMARARWLGREVEFAPARADYEARQALVDALFRAADGAAAARCSTSARRSAPASAARWRATACRSIATATT